MNWAEAFAVAVVVFGAIAFFGFMSDSIKINIDLRRKK